MIGDGGAMAPRFRWRFALLVTSAVAGVALVAVPQARGQSAQASTRDTAALTWRVQLRSGETTTVRLQRVSPTWLRHRLDSLRAEFDGLDADAPERLKVERQIDVLIRALQEHLARGGVDAEIQARLHGEIARSMAQAGSNVLFRTHIEALPKGWIGINVEAPQTLEVRGDSAYVRYLSYPRVVSVEPNSPAEQVGITRGDRLVAYNGADVRATPVNVTRLLRPDNRLLVTVRRDGTNRDFSLIVEKAPLRFVERRQSSAGGRSGEPDRVDVITLPRRALAGSVDVPPLMSFERVAENAPLAGASLAAIKTERMGQYFGVSSGVLVTSVFGEPASSSGLQEGDVIQRADGRDVTTVLQLRRLVEARASERSIELAVVRNRKSVTVKLRW